MKEKAEPIRNCLNCIFCREVAVPLPDGKVLVGQTMNTCQRFPPSPVVISQPNGISIAAMFPTVTKDISCAEHRLKGEKHPLVDGLPERLIN